MYKLQGVSLVILKFLSSYLSANWSQKEYSFRVVAVDAEYHSLYLEMNFRSKNV